MFVSFVEGAFGHFFSRCLLTSPDATWYNHPANGKHPWSWNQFPVETGLASAPAHFLKFFKLDDDPSLGSRIEVPSFGFYEEFFPIGSFDQTWLTTMLDTSKIICPVHDTPEVIRQHFPNCKIVMIDVPETDYDKVIKNHIEKSGSYNVVGVNSKQDKLDWSKLTHQNSLRDWEKYSNNLTDQEWVNWTAYRIIHKIKVLHSQQNLVDSVLSSSNRLDIESIIQVHKELEINYDTNSIQLVLDSFNLNNMIGKIL